MSESCFFVLVLSITAMASKSEDKNQWNEVLYLQGLVRLDDSTPVSFDLVLALLSSYARLMLLRMLDSFSPHC